MSEISAKLVKDLREKTGAGIMDCKKALQECNADLTSALDWLRTKGLASASKKLGRLAKEGLVALYVKEKEGSMIELNSETDFVAKNEKFRDLTISIVKDALNFTGDLETFKNSNFTQEARTINEQIIDHIAIIGENISLRRVAHLSVQEGVIASYIHNAVNNNMGKIGVLVALESSTAAVDKLKNLGRQIAMHIAAAKPMAVTIDKMNRDIVEKEKQLLNEQLLSSGKPKEIIEKMLQGRIRKFYEEVVLSEQVFVVDGKTKIAQIVAEAAAEMQTTIEIKDFVYFALGEGIEKQEMTEMQQ